MAAVPAGFVAFGDDEVRSGFRSSFCVLEILYLADQPASRCLDCLRVGQGVAKRKHERRGAGIERHSQRRSIDRPCNQSDTPRASGAALYEGKLFLQPRHVAVAAADETEA